MVGESSLEARIREVGDQGMSDIEKLGIGNVIFSHQEKDAIHVAIIPIILGEDMLPGTPINMVDGLAYKEESEPIGVIDPFIQGSIRKGDKVWLFLNPGSIFSLRHDWAHPAFIDDAVKKRSEDWLRNFCDTHDCPDYDTLMQGIQGKFPFFEEEYYRSGGAIDGEYLHFNGVGAHGQIPDEFWQHVEIVLGRKPPFRPKYFSCSC